MPRSSTVSQSNLGWTGHWWVAGLRCYDRGTAALDLFKFYHEVFFIQPSGETFLTYYLEVCTGLLTLSWHDMTLGFLFPFFH